MLQSARAFRATASSPFTDSRSTSRILSFSSLLKAANPPGAQNSSRLGNVIMQAIDSSRSQPPTPRTVCSCDNAFSPSPVQTYPPFSFLESGSDLDSSAQPFSNIFELAQNAEAGKLRGSEWAAFHRIYQVQAGQARCKVGPELSEKYNVMQDNQQLVVCVTNRATHEQTWFNQARTKKPQSFVQNGDVVDPTDGGKNCDFCKWETLTAGDDFGRIELEHAVSGSNLFKYCEPYHGVILFKHHDPLHFSLPQLTDLLHVSMLWFEAAHAAHPTATHPFLLWNCLNRAGASQFHGHAQVMLSRTVLPTQHRLDDAVSSYSTLHPSATYYHDLLSAHRAAGLLHSFNSSPTDQAWVFPSLTPVKDMEVVIMGQDLRSPAVCAVLFVVLRTLIDELGVKTFNVGALNVHVRGPSHDGGHAAPGPAPLLIRIVSRGSLSSKASDYGGLEVFGGASIGHTDPFRVIEAIRQRLHIHGNAATE